jgi:hypothetical protein
MQENILENQEITVEVEGRSFTVKTTHFSISDGYLYAQAECGKTSAFISINEWEFRVICKNASHRVWRGSGKGFSNFSEALKNYKKPAMKAIIQAIDSLNR